MKFLAKVLLLTTCMGFLHHLSIGQSGVPTYQYGSCTAFNQSVMNLPCGQTCFDIRLQVPHIKQTSSYILSSICYNPYPFTSAAGQESPQLYCDDVYSPTQDLPFSFCFYDSVFTKAVIGSNGILTFDYQTNSACANSYIINATIPNSSSNSSCQQGSLYYPKAAIMIAYSDLDPRPKDPSSTCPNANASLPDRKIEWRVEGTAPGRKFVLSFYDIGTYGFTSTSAMNTFQIVLHESTGLIDFYFLNKSQNSSTNSGRAIMGIQDWSRTRALAHPNRNNVAWSAANEGWRFIPSEGASRFLSSELLTLAQTHVAWGDTATTATSLLDITFPNVCSSNTQTKYIIKTSFASCSDPFGVVVSFDTLTVNQTFDLYATATSTAASCGPPSGTITVTVPAAAGTAPFVYTLDNPPGVSSPNRSYTFNNVSAGAHTVYVSDANGCGSTIPITVALNNNLNITAAANATSCTGANNGSITVTPPNTTPPYAYSINGGAPQSSNIFNNLAPGSYTIAVSDGGGCSGTTIVTVTAGPPLTATTTSVATTCPGVNNGSVTVTPTSGIGPYQYSIDGGAFQPSNTFTNLSAGTHYVIVKDAAGCQSNSIAVTVATGAGITGSATSTATSCAGVNNGTITATATSGTAPFQYSLDGGAYQTSNVFTNVASGNHNVVIQDAVGCVTGSIAVTVAAGAGITGTATSTATSCAGVNNGTITATATSGTAPYQYSLDGSPYQASNIFTNVSSGNHNVVIKDAVGCTTASIPVNVLAGTGPTGTATSTSTSCPGVNNGTITANGSNGQAPYQYSLDGGAYQAGNVFTNVASGSHNIVVKDAVGCLSAAIPVTVAAGTGVTATTATTATSCSAVSNGTITVTPTNGTPPYQYSLDGGAFQVSNVFTNVAAGSHAVVVKDATTCTSANLPVTVAAGTGPTGATTTTATSCPGVNNGTITVTPSNGTSPYQYSINGGANQPSNLFTNLAAGGYTIVVSDASGCASSPISATVAAGVSTLALIATPTPTSCSGVNNGSITVVGSGGTPPYQYALNAGPFQASGVFTNLAAGGYTVSVKDVNGCIITSSTITVGTGSVTGTATSTATSCNGASNGTITVTPTSGSAPYQFSLDGGASQSSNVIANVAPGPHTVVFTDAVGCASSPINVTVAAGAALTATINQTNVSCNGLSNGSITVNVLAPGTAPFQYSLDNVTFQASNIFNGLAAGNYTVYFKDNLNCTGSQAVTITQPSALTMTVATQPVACNGQSNGVITITSSGGITPYQYSINGTTYQSGNTFNVAAGTYTVYVKDNNGCITSQANVAITQPGALTLSAATTAASCNGGADGTISATAAGGTSAYQYSIDGINFQSSNSFNVTSGNYTVTVKDANNCSQTTSVNVALNNNLTFSKGNDTTICEGASAQLTTTSNATNYSWTPTTALSNPSVANPVASPTTTTSYTVTATLGGCSTNGTIVVTVNPAPVANAGADADVCFGQDAQLNASGGVSYQWTPATYLSSATSPNPTVFQPQQTTQYSLQVTDANGCTSLTPDIVFVKITPPIQVTVNPIDSVVAEGDTIQLNASSIGTAYVWTNPATLSNPNIANPVASMPSGSIGNVYTYLVTASTSAGCKGTATVTLRVYKGPEIYVPTGFSPNGDGKNEKFYPFPVGIKKLNYFRVYNRWGQLLFSTSQLNDGWDGTFGGAKQPSGTYVWVAQAMTNDNKLITRKGTVVLIR